MSWVGGVRQKPPLEMLIRIEAQCDRVSARPIWRSDEVHAPVAGEGLRNGRDLPEPGFVPTFRPLSDVGAYDRGLRLRCVTFLWDSCSRTPTLDSLPSPHSS